MFGILAAQIISLCFIVNKSKNISISNPIANVQETGNSLGT